MSIELVPYNVPRGLATSSARPPALFLPHPKAAERFVDFFTANIRNKNTRRAYYKAVCRFAEWWAKGLRDLAAIKPFHVAGYIGGLGLSKPTVKQQLAALRMLFDWLVVGHVIELNPAHAVRGPKYSVKKGKTPVLDCGDARKLITSIDTKSLVGLRVRALIGTMIYTFARVGAVLQMNVGDCFVQGRRGWVRLHEKDGKEHDAPCHHKLEEYLDEYIAAAWIAGEKGAPLFRITGRFTGIPHRMTQPHAYRMIRRRTRRAGIKTQIGNHSPRATGITDYLKNQGTLENAQAMANHSSPRTTKLYDRRDDKLTLDEYEKVGI